jgi:ribosomal protein S18 acetylase RimI-like enzyme
LNITVQTMANKDPAFYPTVGPFLSRREIVSETGGTFWDDDNKVWFVARIGGEVVGVAASSPAGERVVLCNAWVRPGFRRRGVLRALTEARLRMCSPADFRVVANENSAPLYRELGFVEIRTVGRFTHMRRPV